MTVPTLAAVLVLGWWVLGSGGFDVARWAPGGLALLALLAVATITAPAPWRALPRPVLLAAGFLAAFTAWSFASVGWADDRGYAWEGAGRTLVYLVTFCLFALWPQQERTGAWVLGALGAAIALTGVLTLARVGSDTMSAAVLGSGRLQAPTGYPNATACLMLMGALPAVTLAASPALRPWWRGALVTLAVLLVGVAVLAVSRGATYATPLVLVVLVAAVPGRLRLLLVLALVAAATAVAARALLDVGDVVDAGRDASSAASSAVRRLVLAAVAAGLLTAVVAWLAGRAGVAPATARRLERGVAVAVAGVLVLGLVGGTVALGDPVDRVNRAWSSFKGGYQDNATGQNRLVAGLGSNRYDFYRVGLRTFRDHPLAGVGADGFYQQYLRIGNSDETPRYPHSIEVRTLAQTGVVGAALLLGFFGASAVAALGAMRAGGALRAAVAGGASIATVQWFVHGSLDWFWEWAPLSGVAFALAGLACSLAPRRDTAPRAAARAIPRGFLRAGAVGLGALAAVPLVSLWLADAERSRAGALFASRPGAAYARLDRAASLNPFSAAPATLEGSIAVRLGDLRRADAAFGRALERVPDDQYATLERGAVASARGDRPRALRLLRRAVELAPADALSREALRAVSARRVVDVQELNRRILRSAQSFAQ